MMRYALLFAAILAALPAAPARAANQVEIAPSHEAKIILAGLSFFKRLPSDGNGNLNILLLGTCPVAEALRGLEGKSINALTLRFDLERAKPAEADVRRILQGKPYAALYDCNKGDIKSTAEIAIEQKVIHIAPTAEAVASGALLATEVSQGRPGLVLNMSTVKHVGATFDARLAGVARFIQ